MTTTYTAIIAAAGKSTRMTGEGKGRGKPQLKQFATINGKAVLWHATQPFLRHPQIAEVRIVVDGAAAAKAAAAMFTATESKRITIINNGGETRAATVINGMDGIPAETPVLIHDAARPCLTDESLKQLIDAAAESEDGALLAIPLGDTLKRAFTGKAHRTLSRNNKWRAQTPQLFRAGLLLPALKAHPNAPDDSAAMEKANHKPLIVKGRADNIKITDNDDLQLAAAILSSRSGSQTKAKPSTTKKQTKGKKQ